MSIECANLLDGPVSLISLIGVFSGFPGDVINRLISENNMHHTLIVSTRSWVGHWKTYGM